MERTQCFGSLPGRLARSGLRFCLRLRIGPLEKKNARSQKHKKEHGQYPDILTSRLVKNAYMLNEYHAFFSMLRDL